MKTLPRCERYLGLRESSTPRMKPIGDVWMSRLGQSSRGPNYSQSGRTCERDAAVRAVECDRPLQTPGSRRADEQSRRSVSDSTKKEHSTAARCSNQAEVSGQILFLDDQ